MNKRFFSIKETAELLGVTPLTLRNWDKAGKFKAHRNPLNNYRMYKRSDVESLLGEIETNKKAPQRKRRLTIQSEKD